MIKSQKTKRMMAVLITLVIIAGIMPVDLRSNVVAEEVSETTTVKPTETQIKETTTVEETTTEAPKDIPDLVEDKKIIQGTKREYNPDKERETYPVIILNDQAEDFSKYKFSYHVKTEEEIKNVDLDNTKLKYVSEMPTIDNRVQVKKIIVKVSREGYLDRYFGSMGEIITQVESQVMDKCKGVGFFKGMQPKGMIVDAKFSNFVVYSTFDVQAKYNIDLPITILGQEIKLSTMSSYDSVPVSDSAEFINNINMAKNYVESNKKIQEAIQKVKDFLK